MSTKNSDKNKDVIKELEKTISPILVVNNSALKPYVELFEYTPENIYQQSLGSLVGFFEVKEFSQESAYIVNFLTSVLKKEYYINPKRPVAESLDSALHKVNMALSELAKQGNVEWLGKMNAAICVLEKNNAHFSVSGDAKIFLYRNQNLSEISEGLACDSLEPHPLKTFVNVSSGRLEKDDRLLITSADIFHILTAVEIKKNFQRFEGDKFVQFLKTALSNQMEMIVSIVIGMVEPLEVPTVKTKSIKKSSHTVNVFSEKTFANTLASKTLTPNDFEIETQSDSDPEYIDKKTGHIYVQGEANENPEDAHPQMSLYWDMIKEKITQGSYLTKNEIRRRFSLYKKQLAKKQQLRRIEKERRQELAAEEHKRLEEERVIHEMELEQLASKERELEKIRLEKERKEQEIFLTQEKIRQEKIAEETAMTAKKLTHRIPVEIEQGPEEDKEKENETVEEVSPLSPQSSFLEKLRIARLEQQRNAVIDLSLKNKPSEQEIQPMMENKQVVPISATNTFDDELSNEKKTKIHIKRYSDAVLLLSKNGITYAKTAKLKLATKMKSSSNNMGSDQFKITPQFSRIGRIFSRFSNKQKIYTFGALVLIFIVPLFIVHFLNKPAPPTITELKTAPLTQSQLLANEKNINFNAKIQTVFSNQNIVTTLIADDSPIMITKTSVIVMQNGQPKEFPLPVDAGKTVRAAYMNNLSLVLVVTDTSKVFSFSPVSTKFTDNKINLESISPSSFIGTYLTYLYMLDQKNNQIYRFPRADGGFGDRINWLKDGSSLTGVSDMTIDDNIYVISNNQVLKFFKGQKQTLTLESSATPVHFDKIYTTPDLSYLYTLDTKNSRLIKYSKEGSIISQTYDENLKNGTALAVDEKNNLAYITTSEGLLSISLQ